MTGRPMFTSARNTGEAFRDEYETPPELFRQLDALFHFDLDVCASARNALCPRFYTIGDNALAQRWAPWVCWCNPPYSTAGIWLAKAWKEAQRGAVVLCLVPPRTDTVWWKHWAMRANLRIELHGRVQFLIDGRQPVGRNGKPSSNNTPSCLLLYDPFGQFRDVSLGQHGPQLFGWDWRSSAGGPAC